MPAWRAGLRACAHLFASKVDDDQLLISSAILSQIIGGDAMPTFIMLTRLNADAVRSPRDLEQLERDAMKRVREECPDVKWLSSYAVLGPCDYLDVFIADDIETAARVSALIRTFGHAQTEIWTATEWDRFKEIVRTLPRSG
jgi:uncharacterized protein with GYD domain